MKRCPWSSTISALPSPTNNVEHSRSFPTFHWSWQPVRSSDSSGNQAGGKSTLAATVLGLTQEPARLQAASIRGRRTRTRRIVVRGTATRAWTSDRPSRSGALGIAQPRLSRHSPSRRAAALALRARPNGCSCRARKCSDCRPRSLATRRLPHQLSGGEAQRAALAMALVAEPDVLIADEPTTALDAVVQREILDLIDDLRLERVECAADYARLRCRRRRRRPSGRDVRRPDRRDR